MVLEESLGCYKGRVYFPSVENEENWTAGLAGFANSSRERRKH